MAPDAMKSHCQPDKPFTPFMLMYSSAWTTPRNIALATSETLKMAKWKASSVVVYHVVINAVIPGYEVTLSAPRKNRKM